MTTTLSTESFDLTKVTILPDLTPEQVAIATISDDPDDFMKGMVVYKVGLQPLPPSGPRLSRSRTLQIEPLPSPRPGATSALKYELKYAFRKQVPGVWLADYKDGDAFAAGVPAGIECPIKTQLGRYIVTALKGQRGEVLMRDRFAKLYGIVYAGCKHAVVDLRDSVAFGCGLKRVQEIEMGELQR